MQVLLLAAERNWPEMLARIAMMQALHRNDEGGAGIASEAGEGLPGGSVIGDGVGA